MFRKNYSTLLFLVIGLFLSAAPLSAFAQTAPVRGRIELKKADGTTEKVAKAVIDVYRTDAKGKYPSGKTEKDGSFAFAGLLIGQTYALVISAPGIQPAIFPKVRAGMDGIVITVSEGDGKRFTEDEVRQTLSAAAQARTAASTAAATNASSSGTNTSPATAPAAADAENNPPKTTAEQKKAEEEYQKQVAEVNAKNERTKANDAIIQKSFSEGNAAMKDKNYDLAISKYDEGVNAEPNYAGSAPVLLNAKGAALKDRGFASYSQGAKSPDAALKASMFESAKKDWNASMTAYERGLEILKNATAPNAADQKNYDAAKMNLLANLVEVHRLMSKSGVDRSKATEAKLAYEQYLGVETDAAKKAKAQLDLADILREAGDFEGALATYRKVLETSPDNPDALAGAGLSLFALGASVQPENTKQEQEGLNYLQRFTEVAPENHPLKASVKESVDYLKSKSLTPQKTTKTTTGKRKS